MKTIDKKTLIPWLVSFLTVVVCVVIVILSTSGTLVLSDTGRNALGIIVTVGLIVFAYTSCKYAGVLKGQKK